MTFTVSGIIVGVVLVVILILLITFICVMTNLVSIHNTFANVVAQQRQRRDEQEDEREQEMNSHSDELIALITNSEHEERRLHLRMFPDLTVHSWPIVSSYVEKLQRKYSHKELDDIGIEFYNHTHNGWKMVTFSTCFESDRVLLSLVPVTNNAVDEFLLCMGPNEEKGD